MLERRMELADDMRELILFLDHHENIILIKAIISDNTTMDRNICGQLLGARI